MESPMKTTSTGPAVRLASRYRARFGQSRNRASFVATLRMAVASSGQLVSAGGSVTGAAGAGVVPGVAGCCVAPGACAMGPAVSAIIVKPAKRMRDVAIRLLRHASITREEPARQVAVQAVVVVRWTDVLPVPASPVHRVLPANVTSCAWIDGRSPRFLFSGLHPASNFDRHTYDVTEQAATFGEAFVVGCGRCRPDAEPVTAVRHRIRLPPTTAGGRVLRPPAIDLIRLTGKLPNCRLESLKAFLTRGIDARFLLRHRLNSRIHGRSRSVGHDRNDLTRGEQLPHVFGGNREA